MNRPASPATSSEIPRRRSVQPGRFRWLWIALAWLALGLGFMGYAWKLWRHYSDALARRTVVRMHARRPDPGPA